MKHKEPLDTFLAPRTRWSGRAWAGGLTLVMATVLPGVAHAQHAPPVASGASVDRGKVLLTQYQCGSCHTIPGVQAARGDSAQTLRAWSRRSYIAGRLPNRPDVLVQWIMDPQSVVPGSTMPSMGVSRPDAQHIAAYLLSLE